MSPNAADADPAATADALTKAAALTSAQEFAAILLKDVYEFALEEIANFIGTKPIPSAPLMRPRQHVPGHL